MKRAPRSRVCFLMPRAQPGDLRRVACHLKAGPGGFTEDPDRVTCDFCLKKPDFLRVRFQCLTKQECTCSHRRGRHLGKEGTGRCMDCVSCPGFDKKAKAA